MDIDNCGTRNEIGCLLFRIEEADDGLECVDSDPSPTSVTVSSTLTPSAVTDTLAVADPTDNPMVIGVILFVVTLVMAVLICIEITVAAVIFLCCRR